MADRRQLEIIKQGIEKWNTWRQQNKDVTIDLREADLSRVKLSGADLREANLLWAKLSGADLREANLFKAQLQEADLSRADLREANLREAGLSGANLRYGNLSGADIRETKLTDTNLRVARLNDANLRSTMLSRVDLSGANLSGANLRRTVLQNINLSSTNLSGVDFSGAIIAQIIFANNDLRTVQGLETVYHSAPSTIGIDTLIRSNGEIPFTFLKGAGVPDAVIEYSKSLINDPIEYYTCFVSYSSKDQEFAERLYNDLQSKGVRCWYAPEDMDIGDKIKPRIEDSIKIYDKLLLVLSEHSIASTWVAHEVERALIKEPKGIPNVLYPVRLDDTIHHCDTSWAVDIKQTRHIGDFTHWKDHDTYQRNFQRLLRALQPKKAARG